MPSFLDALVTGSYEHADGLVYCLRFGAKRDPQEALYMPRTRDEAKALETALDTLSCVQILFDGRHIVTLAP